jgi:hypothetical protein
LPGTLHREAQGKAMYSISGFYIALPFHDRKPSIHCLHLQARHIRIDVSVSRQKHQDRHIRTEVSGKEYQGRSLRIWDAYTLKMEPTISFNMFVILIRIHSLIT